MPVANAFKRRLFGPANVLSHWAAGVEPAPRRRRQRTRDLPGHDGTVVRSTKPRVRDRDSREEGLRVRVVRASVKRISVGQLHDLAQVHDGHAVAHLADDGEVVGDEQVGQAEPSLEVA